MAAKWINGVVGSGWRSSGRSTSADDVLLAKVNFGMEADALRLKHRKTRRLATLFRLMTAYSLKSISEAEVKQFRNGGPRAGSKRLEKQIVTRSIHGIACTHAEG